MLLVVGDAFEIGRVWGVVLVVGERRFGSPGFIAEDFEDSPPFVDVTDAALTHLVESSENIDGARGEYDPTTIQGLCNTSVVGLRYRTCVESKWR